MHSTLLYVRSQALHEGDVYRLVVYPATSAYLATITVSAASRSRSAAGTYPAIKLDLQLNKIGKKRELDRTRNSDAPAFGFPTIPTGFCCAFRLAFLSARFRRAAIRALS
jgi:hypothetical protein